MSRLNDPAYVAALQSNEGPSSIGVRFGVSRHGVRRDRQKVGRQTESPDAPPTTAKMDLNKATGEGEFQNVTSDKPLTDWTHIFEKFSLDPARFVIVDDTVRMSVYQQSKRLENGDRDVQNLYSYRARFRRKQETGLTETAVSEFIDKVNSWQIAQPTKSVLGVPVAAILNLADMQLFKPEGGGLAATLERLQRALTAFSSHVDEVRARGWNLNELIIVNNGDPFEGVAGNYANQLHTVEGGLRAQMNAVLDVWLMFARELYPRFEKRQFVSVLCNHTQFGRQGGAKDSITGDEDNGSAFLAETLQRILVASRDFADVKFTIPRDEMNVYTEAAGIPVGFNHGHKIPKSDASGFEAWVNGQVRYDRRAYDARLWVTAHRHNLQMFDIGSASVLQCPSCDGGAKFLTDTTGKHSNAGVVSILVGEHHRLGWSDLQFL